MANEINIIKGNRKNLLLQVPHHGAKDNWDAILKIKLNQKFMLFHSDMVTDTSFQVVILLIV